MYTIAGFIVALAPSEALWWFAGDCREMHVQPTGEDASLPERGFVFQQFPKEQMAAFASYRECETMLRQWASRPGDARPQSMRRGRHPAADIADQ